MTEDPKRWKNRTVHEEADLLGPFNDKSVSDLMRTAISATQRLRDDGRAVWGGGSNEDGKWRDSCHDPWKFLDTVEVRKHQGQVLKDVLRDFVCCFEHSEFRIRQLLFQAAGNRADDQRREEMGRWLAFIFRVCMYAILAVWFDYKRATTTAHIHVNLSTGEMRERWSHEPMQGPPRKHRRNKT